MIRATPSREFEAGRSRVAQIREGLVYFWGNKLVSGRSRSTCSPCCWAARRACSRCLRAMCSRSDRMGLASCGCRRSGPCCGRYLAHRPIRCRAGPKMLLAVGLFGLMTMVFAFSRWFPLSVFALAALGGADMVSVFTRQSLVQIATPDPMRGGCRRYRPCSSGRQTSLRVRERGRRQVARAGRRGGVRRRRRRR